jgi:RNA recognition motif-containing protein
VSIFVGNLPFRAEKEDVTELFAQFGEVVNCALPLERDTGRKRGFAFVEMSDDAAEEAAIEGLQGAELMGRPLRINKAEPRGSAPRRDGGGGGGGYGGGGGGYGGGGGGDRPSGARGWEDRSYGARDNSGEGNAYDEGRSRRRRGSSSGGDDYSGYGGAQG